MPSDVELLRKGSEHERPTRSAASSPASSSSSPSPWPSSGASPSATAPGAPATTRPESAPGSHEMTEALEKHPGLAAHRLPLAFVAEKLEQQGGEASGEIVNGPTQESYDQRAYPREAIAAAQQKNAKAAAERARDRGQDRLRRAGSSPGPRAPRPRQPWTPVGPEGGLQVTEATYTGKPAYVSGRTTALATGDTCTAEQPARCSSAPPAVVSGRPRTHSPTSRPGRRSAPDLPSTAIGSIYRAPPTATCTSAPVSPTAPRTPRRASACSGRPTAAPASPRCRRDRRRHRLHEEPLRRRRRRRPARRLRTCCVGTAVARHGSSSVNGGRFTPPGAAKVGLYETTDGGDDLEARASQDSDSVNPSSPTGADYFRGGISKIAVRPDPPGHRLRLDVRLRPVPRDRRGRAVEADLHDQDARRPGHRPGQPGRVRAAPRCRAADADLPR